MCIFTTFFMKIKEKRESEIFAIKRNELILTASVTVIEMPIEIDATN